MPAARRAASADRRDAAMGEDDEERAAEARLVQPRRQAAEVARDDRADIGVHGGGGEALELLDLRQHVGGEGDIGVGQGGARRAAAASRSCRPSRQACRKQIATASTASARSVAMAASSEARSSGDLDAAIGAQAFAHAAGAGGAAPAARAAGMRRS